MSIQTEQKLSTAAVARGAGVSETFVRSGADNGLIPHARLSNGTRIFGTEAIAATSRLFAERRRMLPGAV